MAKKLRLSKAEDVYAEVGRGALAGRRCAASRLPGTEAQMPTAASRIAKAMRKRDLDPRLDGRHLLQASANAATRCPATASSGLHGAGRGRCHPHHRLRRARKGADEHGRLAGRDVGHARRRRRAVVARVCVRVKNVPGSLGAVMTRDRQQWRQHLQHEGRRTATRCSSSSWSISRCATWRICRTSSARYA